MTYSCSCHVSTCIDWGAGNSTSSDGGVLCHVKSFHVRSCHVLSCDMWHVFSVIWWEMRLIWCNLAWCDSWRSCWCAAHGHAHVHLSVHISVHADVHVDDQNGPESFTPDNQYTLGEMPGLRNFHVAAGFDSGVARSWTRQRINRQRPGNGRSDQSARAHWLDYALCFRCCGWCYCDWRWCGCQW